MLGLTVQFSFRHPVLRAIVFALAFTASSLAFAATYYVDATTGRDFAAGTSPATAWRSLNKVSSSDFLPGDTVLLKRGEMWRQDLFITDSGTATQPITIGAYDTGADPVIDGSDPVTTWTSAGGNIYTAAVATQPEIVMLNGIKGIRCDSEGAVDGPNEWFWASGTLRVYSSAAPVNAMVSRRAYVLETIGVSYVTIRDVTLRYGVDCLRLLNSNHVTLENLTLHDCAGYGAIIIATDTAGTGRNNTIRGCTIYGTIGSTESMAHQGFGHGIFLWGQNICADNVVENNTVHHNGGGGILVIDSSGNRVSGNTSYQHGSGGLVLSGLQSSSNVFERNHVYENCQRENDVFGINIYMPGDNNTVRYNICHDQHVFTDEEIGIPGFTERSGGIRFDGDTYIGVTNKTGNKIYGNVAYNEYEGIQVFNYSNVEVYSNTVYNTARSGLYVGSLGTAQCTALNNVFRNNIVVNGQGHRVWNNNAQNTTYDYNLYYPDGSAAFDWNGWHRNFSQWRTVSGQDAHSFVSDPGFINAAGLDFRLQSTSQAVDRGTPQNAPDMDISGTPRPQGSVIDIGAYEYAAAPSASFTASPIAGGIPLTVQFTDTSTSGTSPIIAWAWDFDGDAIIDSTDQHPEHVYEIWGQFSVSLTVTTAIGQSTHTEPDFVHVTAGPTAAFSAAPTAGVAPLTVSFTDDSVPAGAPIVAWAWDFDNDGTVDSTDQHPTYVYATAGTYDISLTVTDDNGEQDARTVLAAIIVDALPTAAFSADRTTGYTPLTVTFTDESLPGTRPITSWAWDFDNNGSTDSTEQSPMFTYATAGTYTVSLRVATAAGTDTSVRTDYIVATQGVPPTAAFRADRTTGIMPLTVQFTNESADGTAPITGWLWDFGDGSTSTERHPSHTYAVPGRYSVRLSATSGAGADTEYKAEYVQVSPSASPMADFTAAPTAGSRPLTVQFTDQSLPGTTPISQWQWHFGDGQTSTTPSPAHLYTQPGLYTVSLTVSNDNGSNTKTGTDLVHVFAAVYVDVANTSGVEDGTSWATAFTRIQDGINAAASLGGEDVWVADGTYAERRSHADGALVLAPGVSVYGGFAGSEISLAQRDWTRHVAVIDGRNARGGSAAYHVVLGSDGADLDGFTITGGNANNGNAWRDRGAGMLNSAVSPTVRHCTFRNNSATHGGAGMFNASGAAPLVDACRFEQNTATGGFLSQGYGGAVQNYNGAAPTFSNCVFFENTAQATLFNSGQGGAMFNAGASPTIVNSTFHANTAQGAFFGSGAGGALYNSNASPTVLNSILWGNHDNEISTQSGTPTLAYSIVEGGFAGVGNISQAPSFLNAGAGDLRLNPSSRGIDEATATNAPDHDFRGVPRPVGLGFDMGAFEYCEGPAADFSAANTEGTAPLTTVFTDLSTPGGLPIASWLWDFGDGRTSTAQHPAHTYIDGGVFTVTLTVKNAAGESIATKAGSVTVQPGEGPTALFTPQYTFGKPPLAVEFFDKSLPGTGEIVDWQWSFGDGKIGSTKRNPSYLFLEPGEYTVTLTVTTLMGSDTRVAERCVVIGVGLPAARSGGMALLVALCVGCGAAVIRRRCPRIRTCPVSTRVKNLLKRNGAQ